MSAIIPWNDPGGSPCCCTICEDTGIIAPAPRPFGSLPTGGLRNIPIDSDPRPYHYKRIDGATYEAIRQNGFELNWGFNIDATRGTLAGGPFNLTVHLPYNGNCVTTFFSGRSLSLIPVPSATLTTIRLGFLIGIQDSSNIARAGQENLQTWANKEIEPAPSTNSPIVYFYGYSGFAGFIFNGHLFNANPPVSATAAFGVEDVGIATGGNTSPAPGASLTFLGDPIAATFSNNFTGISVNIDISIAAP